MDIFGYFLDSLRELCSVQGVLFLILGAAAGLILGALPGLGGGALITLLVPITYKMNIVLVMDLFVAIYIGGMSGGCIGSILLGIPGTTSSLPTTWDGYAFTKKGDPVRALSAAVVSNFIGTVPSILLAIFTCRIIAVWAVALGPWEYAALCFCAIVMVVGLSEGNLARGMFGVGLAIFISSIGSDPIDAAKRFTFGSIDLYGGISIISLMLGMFAAKLILTEYATRSRVDASKIKVSGFRSPAKDFKNNIGLTIRSWIIGAVVGFLPGLGGPAASAIAYTNEKNLAKNKSEWGKGEIGGVIAPETANNACCGGAMIPMIALGIPGDITMVQFIAVLTIQGINAGPMLIRQRPEIVYMMFTAAILAGILCLALETFGMRIFPSILKIPYHYLYPAVLVIAFTGSYMVTNSIFGVIVAVAGCLLGLAFDYFEIPSMPFMLTYILSSLLEKNIRQAMNRSLIGVGEFFTRPLSCLFIVVGIAVLIAHVVLPIVKEKRAAKSAGTQE